MVGPYAAAWLLAQFKGGQGSGGDLRQRVRAHTSWLRQVGRHDLAAEVEFAYAQLRTAAAEHRARQDAVTERGDALGLLGEPETGCPVGATSASTSARGSAEAEAAQGDACSGSTVRGGLSSKSAGTRLGVSPRTVTTWASNGVLRGHKVGAVWVVDDESVNALAAVRSAGNEQGSSDLG